MPFTTRTKTVFRYLLLFTVFALVPSLSAQEQTAPEQATAAQETETPPEITVGEVQGRIQRIQENTALDATLRESLLQTYNQALAELRTAADWRATEADFANLRQTAPQRIEDLRIALQEPLPATVRPDAPEDASLTQLSQRSGDVERQLNEARSRLNELERESARRAERRRQIPDLIASARQRLTELQTADQAPAGEVGTELVEARRILNRARAQALNAEIAAYNEELASYDARGRLLTLRVDEATRNVSLAERRLQAWQDLVSTRRQEEAERAAQEARQRLLEATDAPPQIREYAESLAQENAALAGRRTGSDGLLQKIEDAKQRQTQLQELYNRVTSEFESVRRKEEAVGLTNAIGQLLRAYRASLPSAAEHETRLRLRRQTIGRVQLDQIEIQEERRHLADTTRIIDEKLAIATFAADTGERQEERLRSLLRDLLNTKKDILDKLLADYDNYLNALLELNALEEELLVKRAEFADFIDERVLWIQSGTVIQPQDFTTSWDALVWLVDWRNWTGLFQTLLYDLVAHPALNGFAIVLLVLGGYFQQRMRRRIRARGEQAERRHCTNFWCTFEATVLTVLIAAYVPAILAYAGWRLNEALQASPFSRVVATSLYVTAFVYFALELPRQTSRHKGLGEAHFGWPTSATESLRRALAWVMPIGVPIVFVIALFEHQEQNAWRESLGQLLFIALVVTWSILGHRLTRKNAPATQLLEALTGAGRHEGVKRLFYAVTVAGPIALGIVAALGYYYTALRLAWRIHISLAFVFLVVIGVGLAMRAFLVARRSLAIEQAKKKRKEMLTAKKAKKPAQPAAKATAIETEEPELDLSLVDVQTTRLTRSVAVIALFTGLWFIWIDFVPALGILDEVQLWETTQQIASVPALDALGAAGVGNGEPQAAAGDEAGATAEVVTQYITLADLLLALLIGILTVVAFRNLPGLLEIAVLQRMPLAPGERYAITTVLGYVLVIVGLVVALSTIGMNWSSIQWLVAALGLGIGFGLQEIVANFVSGLIILFEQPIRVGDVVTIGDLSGTVTRIRIRATTIMDWDRKELVMPNKEFVTGKLINWTLSDSILRVIIPVGVAYGSDTELVRETLTETVQDNTRVLKDPAPQILFLGFDDSALHFDARVFINSIEDRLPVVDELHHDIAKAFREKGIEIAFPQRDIHIRSIEAPLAVQGSGEQQPVPLEMQQE